jgi:hypothetical protein
MQRLETPSMPFKAESDFSDMLSPFYPSPYAEGDRGALLYLLFPFRPIHECLLICISSEQRTLAADRATNACGTEILRRAHHLPFAHPRPLPIFKTSSIDKIGILYFSEEASHASIY